MQAGAHKKALAVLQRFARYLKNFFVFSSNGLSLRRVEWSGQTIFDFDLKKIYF